MQNSLNFSALRCRIVSMERYQKVAIISDLQKKMVLLAGPRQAGKKTLAKEIGKEFSSTIYLNYDSVKDKKIIEEESWISSTELIILDEIHKMPYWKNYLKGVYDTKLAHQKILVTGSARLEIFHQVGDSLAGRYFLHRLMPFSPAELKKIGKKASLDRFIERGPFPEPFLFEELIDAKRWRLQYIDSLLRTDVLDFENIQNLKATRLVFDLLRERVGSPISYQAISEDVGISPNTVKKYISVLEALYVVFRVTPFSKNIARSLLKEPKIYFFDTGLVTGSQGSKLENFFASCLFKHVLAKIDYQAENAQLCYLRTKEQKEVDFALVKEGKIEKIVEVRSKDQKLSKSLVYFYEKYGIPSVQVVKELKKPHTEQNIAIVSADSFLSELYL